MTDPWAHRLPRTPGETFSRLHAQPLLHRLVPTPVAISLALVRGEAEWRLLPGRRRLALAAAERTAPVAAGSAQVRRQARAHLREMCVHTELSWRPWDARRMEIEGVEWLTDARGRGGALLALLHMGPMYSLFHALAAHDVATCFAVAQQPGENRFTGADAHWVREQLSALEDLGHRLVPRGGSYAVLAEALQAGETCALAWDVPGADSVEVLGRPAAVRSGLVRLSLDTGAPILPAYTVRDGLRQRAIIEEPVAAAAGGTAQELTAALAARMDAILTAHSTEIHARRALRLFDPAPDPSPLAGSPR